MSGWDAYINALKGDGKVITGAAIYGQGAAPALWAASSASFIAAPEVAALSQGLTNQSAFDGMSGTGFKIGGTKYMKLNSELNKVIRGKAGENASSAAMSKKGNRHRSRKRITSGNLSSSRENGSRSCRKRVLNHHPHSYNTLILINQTNPHSSTHHRDSQYTFYITT